MTNVVNEYLGKIHPDNKHDYINLVIILDRLDDVNGDPRLRIQAKSYLHNIIDNMTMKAITIPSDWFSDCIE